MWIFSMINTFRCTFTYINKWLATEKKANERSNKQNIRILLRWHRFDYFKQKCWNKRCEFLRQISNKHKFSYCPLCTYFCCFFHFTCCFFYEYFFSGSSATFSRRTRFRWIFMFSKPLKTIFGWFCAVNRNGFVNACYNILFIDLHKFMVEKNSQINIMYAMHILKEKKYIEYVGFASHNNK